MIRNEYAALLDLDGTLIDSLYIYYFSVNHVLSKFDVSCTYEEMFELAGASGVELYTHFLKLHGKYDESMKKDLMEMYYSKAEEMLPEVSFPRESTIAIGLLKYIGYKVAICTGASKKFVYEVVPDSVIGMLDSIVTCDDVKFEKPNPETFLMAADEIGIHPSNCVVIGDSKNDMIGAERAGMKFVLVRNEYNTHINEGYKLEINNIMEYVI